VIEALIVTGFLGGGKTTVLSACFRDAHERRSGKDCHPTSRGSLSYMERPTPIKDMPLFRPNLIEPSPHRPH
jgi:CobW/HypB/UreG, nucleotide-binding domain